MDVIESELRFDNQNKSGQCFLAKLALALTIPSFCSKYIYYSDNSKNYGNLEQKRYQQWCDEYLNFPQLTSKECYAARCSLLHNGDDDLETQHVLAGEPSISDYKLSVPYNDDRMTMVKHYDPNHCEKVFCSNALVICLVAAYKKIKNEYPEFIYPLQQNN